MKTQYSYNFADIYAIIFASVVEKAIFHYNMFSFLVQLVK